MEPLKTQSKHTITDYKRDKARITRFLLVLVGMQNQNNSSCDPHQQCNPKLQQLLIAFATNGYGSLEQLKKSIVSAYYKIQFRNEWHTFCKGICTFFFVVVVI